MKIRLNGDPFELPGPLTIAALLAQLDIEPRRVAVEHNLDIIKRDTVEIVNFVGGGAGEPVR